MCVRCRSHIFAFSFVCQVSPTGNLRLAENCFEILAMLGFYLAEEQVSQLPRLRQVFENALKKGAQLDRAGARVLASAIKAVGRLMVALQKAEQVEVFHPLIPLMLASLMQVLKHKLENESILILQVMAEIAEEYARFFKPHLEQLLNVLAQISVSEFVHEVEPKIRHLAVEIIVLLAERAPVMARTMPGNKFVLTALEAVLKLMMDQEDDPEWALRDDLEDEDMDDDGGDVGCGAIQRLATAIRAKKFIRPALVAVRKWTASPDWRCRSAALLALSQVRRGCHFPMFTLQCSFEVTTPRQTIAKCLLCSFVCFLLLLRVLVVVLSLDRRVVFIRLVNS